MNSVTADVNAALAPAAIENSDHSAIATYKQLVERAIAHASEKRRQEAVGWRLRDDLGPIAYDGEPATARVLLLKANPSYGDNATRETHYQPHTDWPLSVAGPHITAATSDYYHGRVFGTLLASGISLHQISRRLRKVELCPWASKKWPTGQSALLRDLDAFPSRDPIYSLVSQLVDHGAIVLIARAAETWFKGVPSLAPLLGGRCSFRRRRSPPRSQRLCIQAVGGC